MRTAEEIARDITETREWLRGLSFLNVAGKSLEELAELETRRMNAERRLHRLLAERAAFIRCETRPIAGAETGTDDGNSNKSEA